ncbi:hypothetical protein Tco_0308224 [Tanacetum coccineum]
MLLCKQEEAGVQLNAEQADWKDDTDDEFDEHELEAHYMYMAQIQEVTPDSVDNSGPIFDDEPMHKKLGKKCEHLEKELSKSRTASKNFEALQKHVINLELDLQQCKEKIEKEQIFQRKSVKRVIPNTRVSRPQLKSNHLEDRVMSNNSQWKKQEVEDHRRKFKFSNNKTSITACNDSLNTKTSNVNFVCVTCRKCVLNDNNDLCVLHYINGVNSRTRKPMVVPVSTREPKQNVNQSVATDSTVKKSRNITRKLYEQVSKTCSWWYPKYTPPGYNWKPKFQKGNVNPNGSMPLGNAFRTANILEHKTPRCSTVSNTPSSSNSFVAHRDSSIHHRLWELKAHDWKFQTSN